MPAEPTQADRGAYVYYQICMACHGDRGQGLTDEWRSVWEEDENCWQSECHGNNHPDPGFKLVREIPPVIGAGALARFRDAQQLHQYVAKAMPWWNPGYLEPHEFWEVTAFLLRAQKALPLQAVLDESNAMIFLLRPASPPPEDARPAALLLSAILALAALLRLIQNRLSA
jgi:cytochrome c